MLFWSVCNQSGGATTWTTTWETCIVDLLPAAAVAVYTTKLIHNILLFLLLYKYILIWMRLFVRKTWKVLYKIICVGLMHTNGSQFNHLRWQQISIVLCRIFHSCFCLFCFDFFFHFSAIELPYFMLLIASIGWAIWFGLVSDSFKLRLKYCRMVIIIILLFKAY